MVVVMLLQPNLYRLQLVLLTLAVVVVEQVAVFLEQVQQLMVVQVVQES
jgi:hypothetical protein